MLSLFECENILPRNYMHDVSARSVDRPSGLGSIRDLVWQSFPNVQAFTEFHAFANRIHWKWFIFIDEESSNLSVIVPRKKKSVTLHPSCTTCFGTLAVEFNIFFISRIRNVSQSPIKRSVVFPTRFFWSIVVSECWQPALSKLLRTTKMENSLSLSSST